MMCYALRSAIVILLFSAGLASAADPNKLELQSGDTLRTVLERQLSRPVTLKLRAGEDMTGTVTRLGNGVVHLAKISGRDYFDAVIALDAIAAVLVRVRDR